MKFSVTPEGTKCHISKPELAKLYKARAVLLDLGLCLGLWSSLSKNTGDLLDRLLSILDPVDLVVLADAEDTDAEDADAEDADDPADTDPEGGRSLLVVNPAEAPTSDSAG